MWKIGSVFACVALVLAFVQAPFLHVHEDEENNFHAGPALHMHFAHRAAPSEKPVVGVYDADDDAQDQVWVSTPAHLHVVLDLASPERAVRFERATNQPRLTPVPIESGHDPPRLTKAFPRAPPS